MQNDASEILYSWQRFFANTQTHFSLLCQHTTGLACLVMCLRN